MFVEQLPLVPCGEELGMRLRRVVFTPLGDPRGSLEPSPALGYR